MTGAARAGVGRAWVVLLYLTVATALGHVDYHIRAHPERGFSEYSPSVVAGTEPAPGRYRVLAPYAYEAIARLTGAPRGGWVLFRWLSLVGALLAMHLLLRTWFARPQAVTGTLLAAALLPLTFTNSWPHPDHLVELGLFALASACIARGRTAGFGVALVLAALNRETSVFLLPLFLLAGPVDRRRLTVTGVLGAFWLSVYVGLRWWLGFEAYDPWQVRQNLGFLGLLPDNYDPYYRAYAWFVVILAAPFVWAAVRSWAALPGMLRAGVAVVTPLFVLTAFLFSSLIETRIFTPLLPLLVPVAVFAAFGPAGPDGPNGP